MMTRKPVKGKKQKKDQSDEDHQDFNQQQDQQPQSQQYMHNPSTQFTSSTRSRRTKTVKNLNQDYIYKIHDQINNISSSKKKQIQQEIIQEQQKQTQPKFLTPKIQCLLAKRLRKYNNFNNQINNEQNKDKKQNKMRLEYQDFQEQQNQEEQQNQQQQFQSEEQFLVKFQGKSYLKTKWMTRDQIEQQTGTSITIGMLKSLGIKTRKLSELKLGIQHHFNPNFIQADRILSSTQIFTAIHHKKANQIKGKWDQSIMLVCSKLLNFMKNDYPYGVHFHEPYLQNLQQSHRIKNQTNFGQIINKIYLSQFRNYKQFWIQIGRAINIYFKLYDKQNTDNHRVGVCILECSIFLYEQWYNLCKHRYNILRNQLIDTKVIQGQKVPIDLIEENNQNQPETPEIQENYQQLDIMKFCKTNIFLTEKVVQTPKTLEQLELINPGIFSFEWLLSQQQKSNSQKQSKKKFYNIESSQQQQKNVQKGQKYLNYQYKELEIDDMKNLNLNIQVDRLYLVKWKDLSYAHSTWQTQSIINNPNKIIQFKNWNKIPNRQTREKVQIHNKIHKFLLQFYQQPENRSIKNPNISKMQKKLYLLDGSKQTIRQYGGKDIPIFKNYRMLKQFQLQSLNWLIKNWYENRNCILADEMGLGKTIQTISFLYHLHTYQNVLGPFLILAPLTTLAQWRREIEEWTEFNCLLYYDQGNSNARQIIQNYQFYHLHTTKNGDIIPSKIPKFQVLLVNYQLFINDFQTLKKIPFQHMVLDEAHRLKNKRSNTTKVLSQLPCCRKLLLTGTPLQNNTKQLWTLLNFIQPHHFQSQQQFIIKFGNLNNEEEVKQFKKILKPYLLRRIKQDVEKTIPKLYEMIIDVQMTKKQKQVYRGLLQKNKNDMIKGLSTANFNSIAIQLRKCCNHPFLISPDLQKSLIKQFNNSQHEAFLKCSGKIILLMKLLKKFKLQKKKVLIFSQFVIMLDLIKQFLQRQSYNVQILKGSLTGTIRNQAITRFNQDPNTDIFLISTKAGGVGINLISASQIIIYDSDWNPQNDIQATARAHRIGQKKQVTVYRLITSNTYQSQMFQISSKKLGLDKAIFTGECFKTSGQFNQAQRQISKQQIQTLLKKGILGFLQNQNNQQQYFNQTIEDILQKNARKIQYLSNPTSTSYTKTKFISQQNNNDISLDAPDFWQRALKDIQTPLDKLCKKSQNLKQYLLPIKQQQLMLQTFYLIYQFVRNKTVGTGFNNQDQRQLIKFLQTISGERKFLRKYRDIANTFLQQIQKPSRRFRVKYQDLLLDQNQKNNNKIPANNQIKQQKKKSIARRTSKRNNNSDIDEQLGLQQQQNQQIYSGLSSNYQQSPVSTQRIKYLQDIQKICYSCKKPKCTIFCSGICGRSYHKKCYQKILNNLQQDQQNQSTKVQQLQQIKMSFSQWKQNIQYEQKCPICVNQSQFYLQCAQCKLNGIYKIENKKKKKITDYMNKNKQEQNNNNIQQNQQNMLYKCTLPKCNSYYHLKCLYKKQYENKFVASGHPVKDITQFSKNFRCPSHYCRQCYGKQDALLKQKTIKCIQCPISYHQKKCINTNNKNLIKIMKNIYICTHHLKSKSQDELKKQYQPFKKSLQFIESNQLSIKQVKKNKRLKKQLINNNIQQEMQEQSKINHSMSSNKKSSNRKQQVSKKQLNQSQSDNKKKKTKGPVKLKYSYLDINLTPVLTFNYSQYKQNWCRYCGSRYAKSFKQGPWGKDTLCSHHYDLWKSKRITIPEVDNPIQPIHRDKQTEIKYLNEYMNLHTKIKPNQLIAILDAFKNTNN